MQSWHRCYSSTTSQRRDSQQGICFLTGKNERHMNQVCLVPVHNIFQSLTAQLNILLPVYCMTGCDRVSSFRGHGKKSVFRIMYEKSEKYRALSSLGNTHVPSDQETVCAIMFVGRLYGDSSCTSLNRLRCDNIKKQKVAAMKLPPTDDSFMQHLLRVCLQLIIWRQACVGMQELTNILQSGYQEKEATLCPVMTTKAFATPEISNDIVCDCDKDQCYTEACCCFVFDQPCTAACGVKRAQMLHMVGCVETPWHIFTWMTTKQLIIMTMVHTEWLCEDW